MTDLADAVLPLIRTQVDLHRGYARGTRHSHMGTVQMPYNPLRR